MPFAPVKTSPYSKGIRPKKKSRHLWPESVWKQIVDCFLIPDPLENPILQVSDWMTVVRRANAELVKS